MATRYGKSHQNLIGAVYSLTIIRKGRIFKSAIELVRFKLSNKYQIKLIERRIILSNRKLSFNLELLQW